MSSAILRKVFFLCRHTIDNTDDDTTTDDTDDDTTTTVNSVDSDGVNDLDMIGVKVRKNSVRIGLMGR